MAGALTQATNFLSSVAGSETRKTFTLTINGQLNGSRITKNSVKVAFNTVNAPALIIKKKSGLRVSNAFDRALKPEVDFHSRIACEIYFRRAKPTRLAPKAMLERFTKEAFSSLFHSAKESRRLGHYSVHTEDVLLGLIAEGSGIGAKVLNAMGITLEDARIATEKIGGRDCRDRSCETLYCQVDFSPRACSLLKKAESLAYNIGPEHLLLAIISEGGGKAGEVLESFKVDPSKICQEVIRLIGEKKDEVEDDTQGGSQENKMPKAKINQTTRGREEADYDPKGGFHHEFLKFGTDLIKFAEVVRMIGKSKEGVGSDVGGGSGESKVSALEEYGTDLVKVLAEEVIRIDGENRNNEAVGVGGEMPTLANWGTNFIKLAEEYNLDPVIGREIEVRHVIEILDQHTKNNPWLIGDHGDNKIIVDGLALKIADNKVPRTLVGKKVIRLDMSQLVASTKSCGEFEERIKKLMEEIRQSNNIILFIDELQTSIGTGAAEGTIDAKNILKLALARGELQCIVATTLDEYKKHIENDPTLERRFQTVKVLEQASVEEAIEILRGSRELIEARYNVCFTDDALVAAVELTNQYFSDRFLPYTAMDLIQWAGMWVVFRFGRLQDEARKFKETKRLMEKNEVSCSDWFGKAWKHIRDLDDLTAMISKCKEMSKAIEEGGFTVTVADIADIVSNSTGIPVEKVIGEEKEAVDAGGEGSGESKMQNLEKCVIEMMDILVEEGMGSLQYDRYE